VEWRELVYGKDGIVGDILARDAALEDDELLAEDDEEYDESPHKLWEHTKAMVKAGAFEDGGSVKKERATIHLDTNVDPSKMSKFARQEFIEEVAQELGVEPSQIKLRT